ncbi:MAG: hypothetical protein KC652_02565 [Cyanobacteria bacterium HKST-UBA01]|nr:hypothetical protein [Cyanobacteria bacterium HKST-UBA01]
MFKLFSKRQMTPPPESPYVYNKVPKELRGQVVHILNEVVGKYPQPWNEFKGNIMHTMDPNQRSPSGQFWQRAFKALTKEFGVPSLADPYDYDTEYQQCIAFIISADDKQCLDAIDLLFQRINTEIREYPLKFPESTPDEAIAELNQRFKQHNIGYSFINELVEVKSEYVHQKAVEPAFRLLRDNDFRGAEQEYVEAHQHYRAGRYKDAIVKANSAFESTLKTICDKKRWQYDKNSTAKKLITIVLDKELVPGYLQTHFHSLQTLLESGTPVVRNKSGGHGQGAQIQNVPEHIASYALNMAASNIVMLVESYKRS